MKYGMIPNILPIDSCILANYWLLEKQGSGDTQVPISKSFSGVDFLRILLPIIKPTIENFWNKTLIPTYTTSRVLFPGSELPPHIDRDASEYAVTVTLGHNYHETFEYPIYMEGTPFNIPIGWGVTYKGCEVEHWREPLMGTPENYWTQAFFFYVDAEGPNADHAWDQIDRNA